MSRSKLHLGIDIGSTTVKLVVTDMDSKKAVYARYQRHFARQLMTLKSMLRELEETMQGAVYVTTVCGSGGKHIAERLGVHYIQEVVANSAAIKEQYPEARTAIELGGQDAKVLFFYLDEKSGKLQTSDMRMNGSCAGGTGAFIDEVATLLDVPGEKFNALAEKGTGCYEISGRCGVFAKTDIQPLLLAGAKREDIARSTYHAIAKQTIGGLAQGLELKAPIIFEGGPLTFHPELVKVFQERLDLADSDIIIPEHPETIVAYGAGLAVLQLFCEEDSQCQPLSVEQMQERLKKNAGAGKSLSSAEPPLFSSPEEQQDFEERHRKELGSLAEIHPNGKLLPVYIGIDSGSTTSKIVLMDEQRQILDRFYANNLGKPLDVVQRGLCMLFDRYEKQGIRLQVLGIGTTGYGERMMAKAFHASYHTVETVAHARGALEYYPDTSFILDIGGQDMKAIWLKDGIITNIMLNEACSSGCGSFLENFADNLQIPVEQIAGEAFSSEHPAKLGSRCTVFMNSTIINEQREGKEPRDIMAGLCRSIIENVFTKVVRLSNKEELGKRVIVQGGTFRNAAVLKAMEDYLGRPVILAPYPGEMGAIGAALGAMEHRVADAEALDLAGIRVFSYTVKSGVLCNGCANRCNRTVITFSSGEQFISGNRCERGEEVAAKPVRKEKAEEDLYSMREKMLFRSYPCTPDVSEKNAVIGLPRVLEFWDSMPFWTTFFRSLGYRTVTSGRSTEKLYERGLPYVASDTICFPAKLVHGHVADLLDKQVDRIFFPYMMHEPPEGVDKLSPYMCSVLQGYPMVVRNSQNPEGQGNVIYDTPIFHWFAEKDKKKQILQYATEQLQATAKEAEAAYRYAEAALTSFHDELKKRGQDILQRVEKDNRKAVVLAGRPYHNDPFVCHEIYKRFREQNIPVLTLDSLPDLSEQDLSKTRVEITNNFHTRMLEGALLAAKNPNLEYVQIVSFGCGHDAILSDEIVRILDEVGHKSPLILKLDESSAAGSLGIRIQSFVETFRMRQEKQKNLETVISALEEPSPVKFRRADKKKRVLLVPNISHEVSVILKGICEKEGFQVKILPVGGLEEIRLGKMYVHNDICFPAQMVIGELIHALQEGQYNQDEVAVGMVKFQCDCRMSHYAGLLRKGLDRAGFDRVPIVTTDVNDTKKMHPGVFLLGISAVLEAVYSFMMLDMLTDIVRKIRPYEKEAGQTERVYQSCVENLAEAIRKGIPAAKKAFARCIRKLEEIPYDRSSLKKRVFITGELLVTYHPGSNFYMEEYMEKNGMEAVFPRITDQLRKDFRASICEIRDYNANIPPYPYAVEWLFDHVQKELEKTAVHHPLYQKALRPRDMYQGVADIIPETLSCGEGWLMAAEIDHYAREGVKSFIILQPFGCLPNHVCGRGVIKKLKERYPDISILPLDLDPDTSYANVENRLQMLLMSQ